MPLNEGKNPWMFAKKRSFFNIPSNLRSYSFRKFECLYSAESALTLTPWSPNTNLDITFRQAFHKKTVFLMSLNNEKTGSKIF